MSDANTIARPYAQAAFDEARRLGDLKGWSDFLNTLADSLGNAEVMAVISNPRVDGSKIEELVVALCGSKLSAQQNNFIRVLTEGRRLNVVTEVLIMFEALRAEAEKFAEVTVESAFELSDLQKQKIAAALKVRMQREINLTCKIDSKLLGGIVIRADDQVTDGSARTRLEEMAIAMS